MAVQILANGYDFVFQSGQCQKKDVFNVLMNIFINAGWQKISNNPDHYVLQSTGNDRSWNLLFEFWPSGTYTNLSQDVRTTTSTDFLFRPILSYQPGTPSDKGTIQAVSNYFYKGTTWVDLFSNTNSSCALDQQLNYRYYADKERVIFIIEPPQYTNRNPWVAYFGLPTELYLDEVKNQGTPLVYVASKQADTFRTSNNGISNALYIHEAPAILPRYGAFGTLGLYTQLAPRNPNVDGFFVLSEMFFGSSNEGFRGKLGGLFLMPSASINQGDILDINGMKFYVIIADTSGNQSYMFKGFPSNYMAIRIQ